jgi:UDP-N-acetylmuramoyl-tripeptide--D-alanyl-D-alanine ligase
MNTADIYKLYEECAFSVCTDTRNLKPGSLFICLKGANYDANSFARTAVDGGCSYALASDFSVCDGLRIHYVPDTLAVLQELAGMHRQKMNATVIGIGGSNGKTTTKELTAAVLSKRFNTVATQGNLNNHIGVPLTLLRLRPETAMAVVELGTNQPGEIATLCRIAQPDAGIITNIGKEHLEGFGSLEGVAREESELYRYLQLNNGLAFVNADDEWLLRMSSRLKHTEHYGYRQMDNHKFSVHVNTWFPQLNMRLTAEEETIGCTSALAGAHNLTNILAAISIGAHYGIPISEAAAAIEAYKPANNRSQWIQTPHNLIWLDAYNANPSSMQAAMESFAAWEHPRKVLMLGDMYELGASAETEHLAIGNLALSLGFKEVFLVGDCFHRIMTPRAGINTFLQVGNLKQYLSAHAIEGAAILVKGSRGVAMESLVAVL